MPENKKTQEFLQKLAPCIERSDLDACVEKVARVALGVGAEGLLELSFVIGSHIASVKYISNMSHIFYK